MPSTSSMTSFSSKNRTFLPIDAIMYPKERKQAAPNQKKSRRAALAADTAPADLSSQYMMLDGLRGFGKSGARVSQIMSEMNAKSLLKQAQTGGSTKDINSSFRAKNKALASVNEEIVNKVEAMIATKKQPEKVFNNNPPKREVPVETNIDKEQLTQGWNGLFNQSQHRKVPGQEAMMRSRAMAGGSPDRYTHGATD